MFPPSFYLETTLQIPFGRCMALVIVSSDVSIPEPNARIRLSCLRAIVWRSTLQGTLDETDCWRQAAFEGNQSDDLRRD